MEHPRRFQQANLVAAAAAELCQEEGTAGRRLHHGTVVVSGLGNYSLITLFRYS